MCFLWSKWCTHIRTDTFDRFASLVALNIVLLCAPSSNMVTYDNHAIYFVSRVQAWTVRRRWNNLWHMRQREPRAMHWSSKKTFIKCNKNMKIGNHRLRLPRLVSLKRTKKTMAMMRTIIRSSPRMRWQRWSNSGNSMRFSKRPLCPFWTIRIHNDNHHERTRQYSSRIILRLVCHSLSFFCTHQHALWRSWIHRLAYQI